MQDIRKQILSQMQTYFKDQLYRKIPSNYFNIYSLIPLVDPDREYYADLFHQYKENSNEIVANLKLTFKQNKIIACLLGLAIADALGSSTEFQHFQKNRKNPWIKDQGFKDIQSCIKYHSLHARHGEIGIWTDDCSMALAMAYSLMQSNWKFQPINMRYMFTLWLRHGLGNGGRQSSIGLGGNISISMSQFLNKQSQYTQQGNKFNNGNGSLMRLAPVPIVFNQSIQKAGQYSYLQSKMTHNGEEAAQCARFVGILLANLINRTEGNDWKEILNSTSCLFNCSVQSVNYLVHSMNQTQQMFKKSCLDPKTGTQFQMFNQKIQDRAWNWKNPSFTYSPFRVFKQPHYIGSYCMDALAMSLHIIWTKKSFYDCVVWAANMGGDSDTVGAIVGQLAGAIYGIDNQMIKLYAEMNDFKSLRYEVFLVGLKLARKNNKQQSSIVQNQVSMINQNSTSTVESSEMQTQYQSQFSGGNL